MFNCCTSHYNYFIKYSESLFNLFRVDKDFNKTIEAYRAILESKIINKK